MTGSLVKKLLATGALVAVLASPLLAHDGDGGWGNWWRGGHMMGHGDMMRGWGMGGGPMMGFGNEEVVTRRIDGRLAFIKAELKITDAQEATWDGVATTVRNTTESHNAMMRTMMAERMSGEFFKKPLPERLTLHQTHLESRLEQVKELQDSFSKLYAVLTDDQKKVADDIALPMMGMGMGGGMGMGRHMMMQ